MDDLPRTSPPAEGAVEPPRGLVYELARGVLGDPSSAGDLVQEAWLAERRTPAGHVRRPAGWMHTVLRNIARRELRTRLRRESRERGAARREALPAVVDEVARRDVCDRLARAVGDLGEPYRRVVRMRFYEELPPREIARRLERPLNTVNSQLKRGLRLLRERLDEELGDRSTWCALLLPLAPRGSAPSLPAANARLAAGSSVSASPLLAPLAFLALVAGLALAATVWSAGERSAVTAAPRAPSLVASATERSPDRLEATGARSLRGGAALAEPVGSVESGTPGASAAESARPELRIHVVDERGEPVAGADVYVEDGRSLGFARRAGRHVGGRVRPRGATDARGAFRALLRERQDDRAAQATVFARLPGRLDSEAVVLACEGSDVHRVELVLGGPAAELHGRVLDPDGHPVHFADVRLLPRYDVPRRRADGTLSAAPHLSVRTERDGRFHFAWIESGAWELRVAAKGFAPLRVTAGALPGAHAERDLVLSRGAGVTGRVLRADGTPVARARVGCIPLPGDPAELTEARTDARGRFELSGLPPGKRRIWARATLASDEVAVTDLALVAGRSTEWTATLAPAEPLVVRVVDEAGSPLEGWRVAVPTSGEGAAPTDAEGRAEFRILAADSFEVLVRGPAEQDVFPLARARAAGPGEVAIAIPNAQPAELRGSIAPADGRAPVGASLVLRDARNAEEHAFFVDPTTGRFRAERLPQGEYQLELERSCGGRIDRFPLGAVELSAGEHRELEWIVD